LLVGELGEKALLERVRAIFAGTAEGIAVPIGDDAALFDHPAGISLVWTTDILLEGIHFKRSWMTAPELGRRSLSVNLSDLAAMAAEPAWAMVSLAVPSETEVSYVAALCQGIADGALEHGLAVVGGDTSNSGQGLVICIAAGGTVQKGGAVLRSGAAPGEGIYVSGYPGSAAAGLRLMEAGVAGSYPRLAEALTSPEPRLALGRELARRGAGAMIDVSDGVAVDLGHICDESGVGTELDGESFPVSDELQRACDEKGWSALDLALAGGDDYELLFTMPAAGGDGMVEDVSAKIRVPLTRIGTVTGNPGRMILSGHDGRREELAREGFDHFRRDG
jgi:thiamine-monophosphate kinase